MIRSSVNDLVMVAKAPPMITPTARSMTLPRLMNVLNSEISPMAKPLVPIAIGKSMGRCEGFHNRLFPWAKQARGCSMTILRQFRLFLLPLLGAFALSACGINSVPAAEEAAKAKWADVQAQYQRRANLIDNLVATVKAEIGRAHV